jgi:hypothetical protein
LCDRLKHAGWAGLLWVHAQGSEGACGALALLLALGHVELAAAVEPLLLAKNVGGHRLPPVGL